MVNICASLTKVESGEFGKSANRAFDMGANILEIRFDYVSINRFSEAVAEVRPFKAKCIYTLRKASQGGKFSGSEMKRLGYLRELASQLPMMIDVEYETLQEHPEIGSFIDSLKVPILLSWHDFISTPAEKELSELLILMSSYSNNIKVVTMANSVDDTLRVLSLYKSINRSVNLIAFCMGDIGIVSRVFCAFQSNCPFIYAALDRPVAPGQITIEQMEKLLAAISGDNLLDKG